MGGLRTQDLEKKKAHWAMCQSFLKVEMKRGRPSTLHVSLLPSIGSVMERESERARARERERARDPTF